MKNTRVSYWKLRYVVCVTLQISCFASKLGVNQSSAVGVGGNLTESGTCSNGIQINETEKEEQMQSQLDDGKRAYAYGAGETWPLSSEPTTPPRTFFLNNAGAIAMIITVITSVVVAVRYTTRPSVCPPYERAFKLQLWQVFVGIIRFTIVIPCSYDAALAIGMHARFSGFIISAAGLGALTGQVIMFFVVRVNPDQWRKSRALNIYCSMGNLLAGSIYGSVSMVLSTRLANGMLGEVMPVHAFLIVFARFLLGVSGGLLEQGCCSSVLHWFPEKARESQTAKFALVLMLGFGIGPITATIVTSVDMSENKAASLELVGLADLALATSMAIVAWDFPDVGEDARDYLQEEAEAENETMPKLAPVTKLILLLSCIGLSSVRSFIVSSVETATALLLEKKYGWNLRPIGIAISFTFLTFLPVGGLYWALKYNLQFLTWMRITQVLTIIGCILLTSPVCSRLRLPVESGDALVLLIGDAIIFSMMGVGETLLSGMAVSSHHLFPPGSFMDVNCYTMLRTATVESMRVLGPTLSRDVVEAGGQDRYAIMQLALIIGYGMVFEVLVKPRAKMNW